MNTRLFAAAILSIGLLSPVAFAQSQDSSNRIADYGPVTKSNSVEQSTQGLKTIVVKKRAPLNVGEFIDETPAESRQRSSN